MKRDPEQGSFFRENAAYVRFAHAVDTHTLISAIMIDIMVL